MPEAGEEVLVTTALVPPNQNPIADAGADQLIELLNPTGAAVTLNGMSSSDPDGDPLAFEWTDSGGAVVGRTATVGLTLSLGVHDFVLAVSDARGGRDTAECRVIVRDTRPPEILTLSVDPGVLWPPNHKMVPVTVSWSAEDLVDENPTLEVVDVWSSEPTDTEGDGTTEPDWEIRDDGSILLRAERSGKGSGRRYLVGVRFVDASNNATEAYLTVLVPHDKNEGVTDDETESVPDDKTKKKKK